MWANKGTLRSPLNAPKMTVQHPVNPSKMESVDDDKAIVCAERNHTAVKMDSEMSPEQEQKPELRPATEGDTMADS